MTGLSLFHSVLLYNGHIVLEDSVIQGSVYLFEGRIKQIIESDVDVEKWKQLHPDCQIIDVSQRYIMPGMIDIHCDAIEKEIQPRPNTLFPLDFALQEFERKLPMHGITTMYHSLSLGVGISLRGDHLLTNMIEQINRYRLGQTMVRNRIHLRYEISYLNGLPIVEDLLEQNKIDYLSFMDHSPGQGQYRKPGSFEKYVMKNQGVTIDEVAQIIDELMERRQRINRDKLIRLGQLAKEKGVKMAAHDDDTYEKIDEGLSLGIAVSEFPITLDVAKYAHKQGMAVCLGAPNVVRGGSHDQNLSAQEAIEAGAGHILCSDYHPSSMLMAVFKLVERRCLTLPEATRLVSLNPAKAMNCADDLGSIAIGKAADLIVVDHFQGLPHVKQAFVAGKLVYQANRYLLGELPSFT